MSRTPSTPITVTKSEHGGNDSIRKTHPAFGMAGFSRIQGDPGRLFGSELSSLGTFIRFTLHEGSDDWHLHQHWFHAGKTLVEIDMTPNQFAEMLTTMNTHGGVPVTIRYVDGKETPGFKDEDTLHSQIKADIKEDVKEVSDMVRKLDIELKFVLAETSLSKAKKERLTGIVDKLRQTLDDNMPFVLDQYQEAVEKVTANAKAEVDSFMTHAITNLGLESLKQLSEAGGDGKPKELSQ